MRPSQGFGGTGEKGIYFRGTKVKFRGEQEGIKTILGNREHKKTNFQFLGNRSGEQANLFQGNKFTR